MAILWFHDQTEYVLPRNIQNHFPSNTILIHTNLIHFYLAIEQMKSNENVIVILSGPSARQIISLLIEMKPIQYIFLLEYQLQLTPTADEVERKRRCYPPSDDFQNENCFIISSTRSSRNESLLILTWISNNSTLSLDEIITACISIGGILKTFQEFLSCASWYIILSPLIRCMHRKSLIKSIRYSIFNSYLNLFEIVLLFHAIEWTISLHGHQALAQVYRLRYEDMHLFRIYSRLIDGYLKKNHIDDLYYRTNLAFQFGQRSEMIFKSLALYLYNETLDKVKLAEIHHEKVDYVKNGCIHGSIAMIFLKKKQYGMAIHHLNQILNQYIRYNHDPPLDVYLCRIFVQIGLWKLTRSQRYLHDSFNSLREIEQFIGNETSKNDCLYNMFMIYMELKRFTFALDCLDRLLQEKNLDSNLLIEIYRGRGQLFLQFKQLDFALDNYHKALQLCTSTDHQKQIVSINIAIGIIYERNK